MKIIKKIFKTGSKEKQKYLEKIRAKLLHAISEKDEVAIAFLFSKLSENTRKLVLNPQVDYLTTSYTEDPFHFAIRNRLIKSIELFMPYITDINRQPYAVGTSLHVACQQGMTKIVKLLLTRKDINLNAKNYYYGTSSFGGDMRHATALHMLVEYIAKYGDPDHSRMRIIKLLLNDKRTNPNAKNVHGQTAIDKAKKSRTKNNKVLNELVDMFSQNMVAGLRFATLHL